MSLITLLFMTIQLPVVGTLATPYCSQGKQIHVLHAVAAQVGNSASSFCCLIAASNAEEHHGD